jgi:precorrin-2/cobalt-factor-2 C20-methyltransferase
MTGKLYGVGVGPGDSKLLTLRAKEVLEAADVIAVPVKAPGEESTALSIIRPVVELQGKELMPVIFKMEHSEEKRALCRKEAARQLMEQLDAGKNVAMIVLGDVSIYSTYHLAFKYIREKGYDTENIPGISSYSSGAAMACLSLVEGNQNLMIISSLKGEKALEKALEASDNLVVMKAGSSIPWISKLLRARNLADKTIVLSNIGMEGAYIGPLSEDREYGYFTTLIIKKGGL